MFQLPTLDYTYNALEPYIDAHTMQIHHEKHHKGYLNKLNKELEKEPGLPRKIEEILNRLDDKNPILRNNAGGYYNHLLFWENISPNGGGSPKGPLAEAIIRDFKDYNSFIAEFSTRSAQLFGSGWTWLCMDDKNQLCIITTPNQDNPLMDNVGLRCHPILGLDLWEHAYYLNYQNRRSDYIKAFWNIVYWPKVQERYASHLC